jgi:glycosyltransferase involved in cell wall biosynthesis
MKRVIFTVINDLNSDQRMHKICNSLQAHGYDVLLTGRQRQSSKPLILKPFRQKRLHCFFERGKLFYLEYNIRLFWFLLFQKADIICAIDLDTIVACTLAGKIKGCRLVYDAHEYFTEVPEVMHRPAVQKIWQWVEKTFVPKMNACYTVSGSLAALYQQKYGVEFSVIRNVPMLKQEIGDRGQGTGDSQQSTVSSQQSAVSSLPRELGGQRPEVTSPPLEPTTDYRLPTTDYKLPTTDYRLPTTQYPIPNTQDEKFILYQGALNKGRGLEQLIDSMAELPLKLYLAGEGDLGSELRKRVKDLGLENKIIFLGWMAPADLEKLTPKAFLGYNLLENIGKSYYYSLSNKFFDYIHACVPGISNPFPEYKSINDAYKTGIITNLSAPDIVLEVNRALNDPPYYQNLRENCRKAREVFNWQNEEKKLISIYDALL